MSTGKRAGLLWLRHLLSKKNGGSAGKLPGSGLHKTFKPMDEFALELDAFAESIRKGRKPEPDGEQGLRDIIIIDAIYQAAKTASSVTIKY